MDTAAAKYLEQWRWKKLRRHNHWISSGKEAVKKREKIIKKIKYVGNKYTMKKQRGEATPPPPLIIAKI